VTRVEGLEGRHALVAMPPVARIPHLRLKDIAKVFRVFDLVDKMYNHL
jgi:hypothetical protein